MLIKLLDGNLISPAIIERIERYTAKIPDPTSPDTRTADDREWGIDRRPQVNRPAIRVVVGEKPYYKSYFESEAEREAEMTRLEQAVRPALTLVFPNFAVHLDSIQVVHFDWEKTAFFEYILRVTIQLANAKPYVIYVTEALRVQAETLAAAIGVQIPERPKSASELAREMAEDRNP